MLLASSDFRKGLCFIETKNLDGETNLKTKVVHADIKEHVSREEDIYDLVDQKLNCEGPN